MRRHRSAVTLLACAALVVGGCGDDEEEPAASAPATTAEPAATTAATTETESAGGHGGGYVKPGTELALGETAHVPLKPLTADVNDKTLYGVDATVLKIEKGTIDDFKNINLDPEQKKATPYYVTVKIANPGDEAIPTKDGDPDIRFDGIDDRGQEQGSVTFIGDFERCEDTDAPDPLAKGKSYESCLTYLVPGGGSIVEVHWTGADDYVLDPVVWK